MPARTMNQEVTSEFWKRPDTDLMSVADTASALGINRNWMKQVPVGRYKVSGILYYQKGEIVVWVRSQLMPDSLWRRLQADTRAAAARQSRRAQGAFDEDWATLATREKWFRSELVALGRTPVEVETVVAATDLDALPKSLNKMFKFALSRVKNILD